MLLRFRQDVVALRPAVVVILAGTNDIAGNTGPSTLEMIQDNVASMAELARSNGIRVVLCSILPVDDYPWRRGLEPAPKIMAVNAWMKAYAASHGDVYADFHSAMQDENHGMRNGLAYDRVHPTEAGYRVMAAIVDRAIADALRAPAPSLSEHASACSPNDSVAADAVRARLAGWVRATNSGDHATARDVWAPNPVGWFPSVAVFSDSAAFASAGLRYSAAADTIRSTYALTIDDVVANGDVVVVHDIWTESKRLPGQTIVRRLIHGSELWRCQSDGVWRIARFVSAPEPWSSVSP
jgi:ketosteroid isomerase-like protein